MVDPPAGHGQSSRGHSGSQISHLFAPSPRIRVIGSAGISTQSPHRRCARRQAGPSPWPTRRSRTDEGPGARRCPPRSPRRRRFPAPSDARPLIRTEHLLETPRAPNTRGPPSPWRSRLPPNAIASSDPRGPPPRTGPPLRPRCDPNAAGSSLLVRLAPRPSAAIRSSSRASAHASFLRFSVIGSPRSSDSSPVASERRRSTPPQPASTSLSVPSTPRSWRLGPRLSSLGLVFLRSSPGSEPSPPRPTPAAQGRPSRPDLPPHRRRGRELPSPVANPKAAGLVPFSGPAFRRP